MNNLIRFVEDGFFPTMPHPTFKAGDSVAVETVIKEKGKERSHIFKGLVIQIRGNGKASKTFTVRQILEGKGVECAFPLYAPYIKSIKVLRKGKVRRARLFYLRNMTGSRAFKVKEKRK